MKLVFTAAVAAMAVMLCGCGSGSPPPAPPAPTDAPTPAPGPTINQAVCANGCDVKQYCSGEDFCHKVGSTCPSKLMDGCREWDKGTCARETARYENMTEECRVCANDKLCCLTLEGEELMSCLLGQEQEDCVPILQNCSLELLSNFAVKESVAVDVV